MDNCKKRTILDAFREGYQDTIQLVIIKRKYL